MRIIIEFDDDDLDDLKERIAEKAASALSGRPEPGPKPEPEPMYGWDWWTDGDAEDRAKSVRVLREFWTKYAPISRRAVQVLIDNPWPKTYLGEELAAAMGETVPDGKNPRNVAAGYFAQPGTLRKRQSLPICWCVGQPNRKGADEYWMTEDLAALWREAIRGLD
jgi:hypothetical protein